MANSQSSNPDKVDNSQEAAEDALFGSTESFFSALDSDVNGMVEDSPVENQEATPEMEPQSSTAESVSEPESNDNWKKRYSDSTREAQRMKAELDELKPYVPVLDAMKKDSDLVEHVKGYFKEVPYSYFQVEFRKGLLNFRGNSFLFKAHIKVGTYANDYEYKEPEFENIYKIEQRMQKTSNKQEIKDIRTTDDGELKDADAQAGNVPAQKFKNLIKQWAGVNDYDFNIPPVGTPFSDDELKYWAKEYDDLNGQDLSVRTGAVDVDLGETTIMGQPFNTESYFQILGQLDRAPEDNPRAIAMIVPGGRAMPKGSFSAKIRNKCYNLRFLRALTNAKKSTKGPIGNRSELCMLLVRLYYLAAKMKLDDKDLQGPFVKLS